MLFQKSLKKKIEKLSNEFQIAIDGTSGSGKGSLAKNLANFYQLHYLPSSILYRKLAACINDQKISLSDTAKIIEISANHKFDLNESTNLYINKISDISSKIATIKEVRVNLNNQLHNYIKNYKRIIIDGRDIAQKILPNADLKIYIDADLEKRALRRFNQLKNLGKECILQEVFDNLQDRDIRDKNRQIDPLLPADDALIIDTSNINEQQTMQIVIDHINNS